MAKSPTSFASKGYNNVRRVLLRCRVMHDLNRINGLLEGTKLGDRIVKKRINTLNWIIAGPLLRVWDKRGFSHDGYKNGVVLEAVNAVDSGLMTALFRIEWAAKLRPGSVKAGIIIVPRDG